MILRKTITSKNIKILTGILWVLAICCLFIVMAPLRVHAETGSDLSKENRYRVTIYWHVDNPFSADEYGFDDNYFTLLYYETDDETGQYTGELNQVENIYWGSREGSAVKTVENVCDNKGSHSVTLETDGPPLGLFYNIQGNGTHISRYYVDKIDVELIDPVEGTGQPSKRTLWTGGLGAKNAHLGGAENYCVVWFDTAPPEFTDWDNDSCTDKAARTDSYDEVLCRHPYIEGITPLTVNEPVNVPEDDNELSIELNAGILYDNSGARWPLQKFDITCDHEEKNIQIAYGDGKWYLILHPDSNASEDYSVTIDQHVYEGEDHPTSTSVTIRTFDYNFTFVDENGTVLSQQTIDYGSPVTLPEVPEGCTARYECDQTAEWKNTTAGPKDRTIKVFYITDELIGGGTKEDPYLIRNSSDWESMRRSIEDGETGKFYRLEDNIHVISMIGTEEQPFTGTFDGNGKTLDVLFSNDSDAVDAPFAYVRNASISNLTVTGSITGTANGAAGLIGYNLESSDSESDKGTVITNCTVYADISGNNEVGGFAVGRYGRLTILKSSYKGSISGQTYAGGFVGFGTQKTYLLNCLFDPESVENSNPGAAACFVVGQYGYIRDCIYTAVFGTAQGQASTDYRFIFRNSEGTIIDEQMVHQGEQPLVPISDGNMMIESWQCGECADWTDTTNGILKRNVIAVLSSNPAFRGSGTEDDPYEIYNEDDWHSLKLRVRNFGTAGEYYRQESDLYVNEMIGTEDQPFSGSFSGERYTLHITLSNDDDYERTAPFSYVTDAAFKYLRVTGSVTGDADRASGLIGDNNGTTTINDCIVSAAISGKDFIGGFCSKNNKKLTITDSTFNGKLNISNGAGFVGCDTGNYGSEDPDSAHMDRCLFDPMEGSTYDRGDPFAFYSHADCASCLYTVEWNDDYYYSFPRHGIPFESKYLEGDGTEENPKKLYGHGAFGWEALRLITERESTEGVYFQQESYMKAFSTVGDYEHYFEGNFDGNGNILEVCYDFKNILAAPFSFVHNATIRRATLIGTINGERCAGLVGDCKGITRIEYCDICTEITGTSFTGGYVSMADGLLNINSCSFKGTINGEDSCGGFVAKGTPNTRLDDCYFTPSGSSACWSGCTFVNMIHGEITNCFYSVPFGTAQGEHIHDNVALVKVKAKSATLTATGNIEHFKCSVCGKLFADKNGTKETTAAKVTIPKLISIKNAEISGIRNKTYTGKTLTQNPKVVLNGTTLKKGTDYTLSYKDNKNAGKATVIITGKGKYGSSVSKKFVIGKADNPMTVRTGTPSAYSSKKTTIRKAKAFTVRKAQGKVTFRKTSGNSRITVDSNGNVTVKKGLKKDTAYFVKVKVSAAGSANYKAGSKTVTLRIMIK